MRLRLAVIILIGLMALSVRGEYVTAVDGLRIRSEPNTESEILGVLPYGAEVTGKIRKGWMKTDEGYLSAEYLSDRSPLEDAEYLGSWLTTAYTHTGSACYNGHYPEAGYTVATNSLPIGTEIYIEGIGFRTVEDRGPSYMPYEWLDVFLDGYGECVAYGEQYRNVWIISQN